LRGFTFIEILIGVAVLATLATLILGGMSSFRESANLNRARDIVIQQLKKARIRTLSSNSSSSFGVRFASSSVVLFKGNGYNQSDPSNETENLPALTEIINVGFTGTTSLNVYFKRLTGEPTNTGIITLRSTRNPDKILRVQINAAGLIDTN